MKDLFATRVSGFTVVEVITAVFIISLLVASGISVFGKMLRERSLTKDIAEAVALLEEARSLTLSSKESMSYGVHFASRSMVRFQGNSYATSSPSNVTVALTPRVAITDVQLQGGSDIVFERLTGNAVRFGSITFSLLDDASRTKTITVLQTGIVEW